MMSEIVNSNVEQVPRASSVLRVKDPALVVAYFFNGSDQGGKDENGNLVDEVFHQLAQELEIHEPFRPSFLRVDTRFLSFTHYRWSRDSRSTLAQFRIKPSEVWCIQLGLPLRDDHVPVEEALSAWQEMEHQLEVGIGRRIKAIQAEHPGLYWGSSRLYWALSEDLSESTDQSQALAEEVQVIAYPERADEVENSPMQSPVRVQAYEPWGHTGELGVLWRLDEPAVDIGTYQAAWLLLSPQAQEEAVMVDYVFNGRFAVGEAYPCKAHYQAGEYPPVAQDLRDGVQEVQENLMMLLEQVGPSGFAMDQIEQAQQNMHQREERVHDVAVAYSNLLVTISAVGRLHLTVKTNVDNYEKAASEFSLWEHLATRTEILRLKGVLRQIEHDQQSWRASLDAFQAALGTVRAGLDLTGERIAAARLNLEQEQAEREKRKDEAERAREKRLEEADRRWEVLTVIIGTVLSVSQIIPLTSSQQRATFLWSVPVVLVLLLVFMIGRRAARRRR